MLLASPLRTKAACSLRGVCSGLTSMTTAPWRSARNGSEAAGSTRVEVPTERKTLQALAASKAGLRGSEGGNTALCGDPGAGQHGNVTGFLNGCDQIWGEEDRCCGQMIFGVLRYWRDISASSGEFPGMSSRRGKPFHRYPGWQARRRRTSSANGSRPGSAG